jgi:hypothetical protein
MIIQITYKGIKMWQYQLKYESSPFPKWFISEDAACDAMANDIPIGHFFEQWGRIIPVKV